MKNLANNYQSELKRNGINISEKERGRCMLSSTQPSKIIEEMPSIQGEEDGILIGIQNLMVRTYLTRIFTKNSVALKGEE